jgi:hypothetical protein
MDYKDKYLKYKNKYLNKKESLKLKGGEYTKDVRHIITYDFINFREIMNTDLLYDKIYNLINEDKIYKVDILHMKTYIKYYYITIESSEPTYNKSKNIDIDILNNIIYITGVFPSNTQNNIMSPSDKDIIINNIIKELQIQSKGNGYYNIYKYNKLFSYLKCNFCFWSYIAQKVYNIIINKVGYNIYDTTRDEEFNKLIFSIWCNCFFSLN